MLYADQIKGCQRLSKVARKKKIIVVCQKRNRKMKVVRKKKKKMPGKNRFLFVSEDIYPYAR